MPPSTFYVISVSWPDSVGGGGVVAKIFRDPRRRTRFSGGGVVAAFSGIPVGGPDSVGGGGVVAEYQKVFGTFHIQGREWQTFFR